MEVTHVILGEEWLPSAPLHVLLYRAFGWEDTMPRFAHLPLLLKPEGNGKLSKRDGDRLGFPVFPLEWHDPKTGEVSSGYREKDYLPEAVINFLALLGWNPGDDREIMTMDEMIDLFNLEKCSKAGARFNYQKLVWFNHEYIMLKSDRDVAELFRPVLESHSINAPIERIETAVGLVKNRVNFIGELWDNCKFLFQAPTEYDEKSLKKWWKDDAPRTTAELCDFLESQPDWNGETLEPKVMEWIASKGYATGKVMNALRVTLVGAAMGPQIFLITDFLGREETLNRARKAIAELA
jgi:glutamyl-tRNA synthetase